jgi:hypothetical protein
MPLSKRQFDLGVDDEGEEWMRQAYRLLAEHRDLAYSAEELEDTILGDEVPSSKSQKFGQVFDTLAEIGAVDKGVVDGTIYYVFVYDFDTKTWEPDLSKV